MDEKYKNWSKCPDQSLTNSAADAAAGSSQPHRWVREQAVWSAVGLRC